MHYPPFFIRREFPWSLAGCSRSRVSPLLRTVVKILDIELD